MKGDGAFAGRVVGECTDESALCANSGGGAQHIKAAGTRVRTHTHGPRLARGVALGRVFDDSWVNDECHPFAFILCGCLCAYSFKVWF